MSWLTGKKTYLLSAGLAALSFAYAMGWISKDVYEALAGLLGAGSIAALRAGVAKAEP
jgi:hypothetical protein